MMASSEKKEQSDIKMSFMAPNILTKHKYLWIRDTGASTHMTHTLNSLFNLKKEKTTIKIGNGTGLNLTIVGTLKATVEQEDGTRLKVTLKNVAYVPELTSNLFSITKAMENGYKLSNKGNIMILSKGSKVLKFENLQKTKNGYCPGIKMIIKIPYEKVNIAQAKDYLEAHQLLGHPGMETTITTAAKLGWKLAPNAEECEACSHR